MCRGRRLSSIAASFLNDESPDLTRWVREKYGTVPVPGGASTANYGRGFYTNLFELILRLKGNYLWPAMWNNRFNEDDPENPRLADEYGIVMGTSHQEPMLRAQKEWDWGNQLRKNSMATGIIPTPTNNRSSSISGAKESGATRILKASSPWACARRTTAARPSART